LTAFYYCKETREERRDTTTLKINSSPKNISTKKKGKEKHRPIHDDDQLQLECSTLSREGPQRASCPFPFGKKREREKKRRGQDFFGEYTVSNEPLKGKKGEKEESAVFSLSVQ